MLNQLRLFLQAMTSRTVPPSGRELFDAHITRYFGSEYQVIRENRAVAVHVDLYAVPPTKARPFHTLMTAGMSDRAMMTPAGLDEMALAEICLCLPEKWPMDDEEQLNQEQYYWPVRLLKAIARYPHLTKTWVTWGSTMENPKAYDPEGRFRGVLLTAPARLPIGSEEVVRDDGRAVRYLAAVPLTLQEIEFERQQGAEALDERLTRARVTDLVDLGRKSVV
jgi:hypothetical protein